MNQSSEQPIVHSIRALLARREYPDLFVQLVERALHDSSTSSVVLESLQRELERQDALLARYEHP